MLKSTQDTASSNEILTRGEPAAAGQQQKQQ
jgi:hypothetical protein